MDIQAQEMAKRLAAIDEKISAMQTRVDAAEDWPDRGRSGLLLNVTHFVSYAEQLEFLKASRARMLAKTTTK